MVVQVVYLVHHRAASLTRNESQSMYFHKGASTQDLLIFMSFFQTLRLPMVHQGAARPRGRPRQLKLISHEFQWRNSRKIT